MSEHTIMIIKNNKNEYLNYYDEKWASHLFLNNKVIGQLDDNIQKKFVASELNTSEENIEMTLVYEKIHTKFSESAKKNKEYHHYFYNVKIKEMPITFTEKEFSLNGINYKWFSIKELEEDKRIQEVNSDIVAMIKDLEVA